MSIVGVVGLLAAIVAAQGPAPQPTSPQTAQPSPPATKPAAPRVSAGGAALAVQATDHSGNPVGDVSVRVTGPVDRTGTTARDGSVTFRSMRAGTYRLRFEHETFITLERELTMRAQPTDVSVALSAAPPKPQPVAPVVAPPPPPAKSSRVVEPHSLSIPDYLDKNLIGSEPVKTSLLACAEGGTAVLLQVREPLTDLQHAEADEILYVVAGAGILRMRNQETKMAPGHFALVPRGVSHTLRRDGRNPMIAVSLLAGTPCTETTPPAR